MSQSMEQDILFDEKLFNATKEGDIETVKDALESGVSPNAVFLLNSQMTFLCIAAETGQLNLVVFLIEKHANVDLADVFGHTPLWLASRNGHLEIVEFLFEKGANIDRVNTLTQTPLWGAAYGGAFGVAKYLIEKGANMTIRDYDGQAPLDIAVKSTNANALKVVRLLLLHGANPLLDDNEKVGIIDCLERAKEDAKHEIESYLENPIRYRSYHSALIALSIGLASLDLPVLIVTLISEYLVSINEEKLFGQYSQKKSWDIAVLINKKSKEN